MRTLAFVIALLCTTASSFAADDVLIQYLTGLPFYTSGSDIAPDLVEQLKRACNPARSFTLRKATLLESAYDRRISIKRVPKEGPSYEEPGMGPQPQGFLFTIRLFSNDPSPATQKRQDGTRIDRVFINSERAMKWGGAIIPTKDRSQFYSIHLEAGLEVSDEMFGKIIAIVSDYAQN